MNQLQVKSSELYDEFRIESGLLVKVYKYKILSDKSYKSEKLKSRKYKKKVSDLSRIYQLKEDVECDCGAILLKGSYIYLFWGEKCGVVVPVANPKDFYIEVTCSGGVIGGHGCETIRKINKVSTFLKDRYGLE